MINAILDVAPPNGPMEVVGENGYLPYIIICGVVVVFAIIAIIIITNRD